MALSWSTFRNRVYEFCDLSETRVSTSKVDDWIRRAISDVAELIEDYPQLWDALMFLQRTENMTVASTNQVLLPASYLRLHREISVRNRTIRIVKHVPHTHTVQDEILQPTVEEPIAVVVPDATGSNEVRTLAYLQIYPKQFASETARFKYIKVPQGNELITDESAELLLAKAAIIALESLNEGDRLQLARGKFAEELAKYGVKK